MKNQESSMTAAAVESRSRCTSTPSGGRKGWHDRIAFRATLWVMWKIQVANLARGS